MVLVCQIFNVYSLGLAIVSVVFLQWLLLYQRRQHPHQRDDSTSRESGSSIDLRDLYEARPASPDIVLPSITVVPPSPTPSDLEDDDDADTVLVEEASSPPENEKATNEPSLFMQNFNIFVLLFMWNFKHF